MLDFAHPATEQAQLTPACKPRGDTSRPPHVNPKLHRGGCQASGAKGCTRSRTRRGEVTADAPAPLLGRQRDSAEPTHSTYVTHTNYPGGSKRAQKQNNRLHSDDTTQPPTGTARSSLRQHLGQSPAPEHRRCTQWENCERKRPCAERAMRKEERCPNGHHPDGWQAQA